MSSMQISSSETKLRRATAESGRGEGKGGGDRQEERRIERKETKTTTEKME